MFPFDQPTPTSFYLVLYLATMVLHVVPMNYVLAGSSYLALVALWEAVVGRVGDGHQAIIAKLRDWMPFALSVAITAGVAPLLFLQVLYRLPFYTANLLLFHRWMAILPVLIAAFYLLYVQKGKRFGQRPALLRAVVAWGVLVCFGFVAWSWTENHLLSTRGQAVWVEQYAAGGLFYGDPELPPRLAVWWLGAFANLAWLIAWQLRGKASLGTAHSLAKISLTTLTAAGAAALVYYGQLSAEARSAITGPGAAYVGLVGVGAGVQCLLWTGLLRGRPLTTGLLGAITAAALLTTAGFTVLRELRRLTGVAIADYYPQHQSAGEVSGFAVFLIFAAVNLALIGCVIRIANRPAEATESPRA